MRSKARCSSAARSCSGCATASGSSRSSAEIEALAASVPDSGGVCLVPAFTGLGSPHWDPHARGTIVGLTRGTTRAHIARAALEAIAFQSAEVLAAMQADAAQPLLELRVDGGAARNDLLLQFQADLLGVPVVRAANHRDDGARAPRTSPASPSGSGARRPSSRPTGVPTGASNRRCRAKTRQRACARWSRAVERSRGWEGDAGVDPWAAPSPSPRRFSSR